MTNDPGRPSADQKRHCDCPRTCSCTKKNCKCDRNCTCTQTMYMLVYVPMGDKESEEESQNGRWQIGHTVITDLKGNKLTDDEIKLRRREKSRQQQRRPSRAGTLGAVNDTLASQSSTTSFAAPVSIKTEESATLPASTPKSGCCQRKNTQDQQPMTTGKNEAAAPVQAKRPRGHCNCGDSCGCAICLDHPNNAASHRMVQQRAAEFSSNELPLRGNVANQSYRTYPEEKGLSCMGTIPQFAWHNNPHPGPADLQKYFGVDQMADGGYFINYPVHGYPQNSAAPAGSCCSSSMPSGRRDWSSRQGSSQFLPFVGPNAELLESPHLDSHQDFANPPAFPEPVISQPDFPPSLTLGGEIFPPEPYVGQATVAGVYGMGDNWSDFCDTQPMHQLWPSTGSRIEPSCNASTVVPDFKTDAASFPNMAPLDTVNHFNATTTTRSLPPKPQTAGGSGLPGYVAKYDHLLLSQDHNFKTGHSSPAFVSPCVYTAEQFATLELEPMDLFTDMEASHDCYHSH